MNLSSLSALVRQHRVERELARLLSELKRRKM